MRSGLTVRARLLGAFAIAALAPAVVGVVGFLSARSLAARAPAGAPGAQNAGILLAAGLVAFAATIALGWAVAHSVVRSLARLAIEMDAVRRGVERGELGVRADPAEVEEELRPALVGMNEIVEAFSGPIALTTDRLARLAEGETPSPVAESGAGQLLHLAQRLNELLRVSEQRAKDLAALAAAIAEGRLDRLGELAEPLRLAASCVERLARGEIPERMGRTFPGEPGALIRNLDACLGAIEAVATDVQGLGQAAVQGRLSVRADPARHQGRFRELVAGVNAALDAVVGPLSAATTCVERISRGEIPPHLPEPWSGELVRLREGLDTCIDAVNALVHDTDGLVQFALAGKLATRADASRHRGDFARIIQGVNQTLDAAVAPVIESARVLERLSARDLRARVMGRFLGDHARITDAVNDTSGALHDAISQVSTAVAQVSNAASRIASSSQSVASGASQQAVALEAIASSIETVSSITRQAADNAQLVSTLAETARTAAGRGTEAVAQLQGAMGRIRQSAEGTGQIIRDVSDIAFQTNLLALNAAVEAARAGEAGRGFAVVAEEVRSLALRAKQAATKTEDLIRQSMRETGEGEVAAGKVAETLQQIAQGVTKVTGAITEIAALSRDQTSRIGEVTAAVSEMEKITQLNAASAEESSSAASELSGQAEELAAMASSFRLQQRTFRIGFSNVSVANSWRVAMLAMLQAEAAKHPGVELVCTDAQDDPSRQVRDVEQLLADGIDLLLIAPATPDALNGVIEKAQGRGIPVIVFDRRCTTERYTATVGIDDVRNGELSAQRLVEALRQKFGAPRGDVVMIQAFLGTGPQIDREQGILSVLSKHPDIRIVARAPADYQRDKGAAVMQELLRAHPHIDAVMGQDGASMVGAYEAAERAGRAADMIWVGIDGYNGLLKLIKAGKVEGSVLFPAGLGAEALLAGLRLLNGEQVPKRNTLPNVRVTQANVDAYVDVSRPDDAWTY